MKKLFRFGIIGMSCCSPAAALAYDVPNHFDMSQQAVINSVLQTDPTALPNLGLRNLNQVFPATTDADDLKHQTDDCQHGATFSIQKLVACGAEFEDVGYRSLNHFFDPIHNAPLTVNVLGTMRKPGDIIFQPNLTSPSWALQDDNDESAQVYSYKDARNYFYQALTTTGTQSVRDQLWGKLFQSVGQIIHHLQDMAQPQHVRNDEHVDKALLIFYYNPSLYESYASTDTTTSRSQIQALAAGSNSVAVYSAGSPSTFKLPRDFWKNAAETGMAEFTNQNFVSEGTNFEIYNGQQIQQTAYNLPSPGTAQTPVRVQDLVPPVSPQILNYCGTRSICNMTFYSTNDGTPRANPRASTLSIFDQYVQVRPFNASRPMPDGNYQSYYLDRLFTLNKYNHLAAYPFLIPRAVSYSAGLINFFFRGRLQISLPNEGVYAMVDHTVAAGNDPAVGGFPTIKLKIQNMTPGGEQIPEGTSAPSKLVAVVKFHRNNCYSSNLSGEYGSPGKSWGTPSQPACRSPVEEIVVSDPMDVPVGINTNSVPITFSFSNGVIPISATDLFLQVVYRGPLGQESDSVIVATKDISEPTYIFNYSREDQYSYCHNWPLLNQGSESCPSRMFDQWCTSTGGFASVNDCAQAEGVTHKYQFSKDDTPVSGWDPATSSIPQGTYVDLSQEPSLTPVVTQGAPVGKLSRVAALFDITTPTNAGVLVWEHVDNTHNSQKFRWYAITAGPPTIVQFDPTTNTLIPSVTYQFARGVYLPSDQIPLASSGDAQTISSFANSLVPSQFAGGGGWYWPSN